MEEGYRAFRIAAGDPPIGGVYDSRAVIRQVAQDCRETREGVGPDGNWCIDFHQRFELNEALRLCRAIEEYEYGSVFRGVVADNPLWWVEGDRLVFPWEKTGWMQLYDVPASGGRPVALTSGPFEVEFVSVTADHKHLHARCAAGELLQLRGELIAGAALRIGEDQQHLLAAIILQG